MSDVTDCTKIEAAVDAVQQNPNEQEAKALVRILDEVNGDSRILGTDLVEKSFEDAKELNAKGEFTRTFPQSATGRTKFLMQDEGTPRLLEIADGNRKESIRFDIGTLKPSINTITRTCSDREIRSSFMLENGKPYHQYITLPSGLEINRPL